MHLRATFDVFLSIHRPRKGYCVSTEALGTAKGWWPSAKPGPLTPTPSCQWLSVTFNHEEEMHSL